MNLSIRDYEGPHEAVSGDSSLGDMMEVEPTCPTGELDVWHQREGEPCVTLTVLGWPHGWVSELSPLTKRGKYKGIEK